MIVGGGPGPDYGIHSFSPINVPNVSDKFMASVATPLVGGELECRDV